MFSCTLFLRNCDVGIKNGKASCSVANREEVINRI